jgi:hypothetical protein
MTLSALGIFSAAGAGGVVAASDYDLISTTTLGTATPSVTFSSLGDYSSTYKHLQIRTVGRVSADTSGSGDAFTVRFNGDSGSNYALHQLFGNGSTVTSNSTAPATGFFGQRFTDSGSTSNAFGAAVIDILDSYSTSKNKTARILGGNANNTSYIFLNSGVWISTASITSITLSPNVGGNFVAGSRFSLYGIKG